MAVNSGLVCGCVSCTATGIDEYRHRLGKNQNVTRGVSVRQPTKLSFSVLGLIKGEAHGTIAIVALVAIAVIAIAAAKFL